jgi:hypothetical protein
MFFYYYYFLIGGNKKRVQTSYMDTNLIRIAPECHDTGGLADPYRGTLS